MISKGHTLLLEEALRVFQMTNPDGYKCLTNMKDLQFGVIAPDFMDKDLGSHYALFIDGKYYNRLVKKPRNAFNQLEHEYALAIKEKSMDHLGRALHFVMDMLTIPHATGLTDATFIHSFTRPHRKYEKYTADNMEKYFQEVKIDEDFFTSNSIFDIMVKQAAKTASYKEMIKNKKYYDDINKEMIPLCINYVVGFLTKYAYDVK